MTPRKERDQPPDGERLLEALEAHHVRYTLTGSVAAQFYGVEVQPGDLDITPDLDLDNLPRLSKLLVEIEATLPDTDAIGHWEAQLDGE